MRRDGFTLIEVIAASALLTAALAMIWQAWMMSNNTSDVIGRKMDATVTTAHAFAVMNREIRQAAFSTLSPLPSDSLSYRVVEDLDGNGFPVDSLGHVELGPVRTITRDHNDANKDGRASDQLVLISGDHVHVLANDLPADESTDSDGNGVFERGIWFEAQGQGVLVSLRVIATTSRDISMQGVGSQLVTPRNL
jgi:prepilin-type N-terminal cleavage/methylation domain-containing protein